MSRKEELQFRPSDAPPKSVHPHRAQPSTVADMVLSAVEREGVEHIFGVPGSAVTPMYESIAARGGLEHILAKHEGGAAFMAAGYARVKGTLGVCMTTTGPGATNAITGVAAARADSVPLLILTGQNATKQFGKGPLQDSTALGIDTVGLFRHVTKLSTEIPAAERANEMIEMAIRAAVTGRPGPVHLSLPVDIQKQPTTPPGRKGSRHVRARVFDPNAVNEVVRLLASARKPAILAGHGVTISRGWKALVEVAISYGIPVATTPKGKGLFPEDHPLSLGVFGFGGHLRAEAYLLGSDVDVLLVVGSSLGELQTNNWDERLQPSRAFIQVDIDPAEIGRNYPVDVGVVGDARAVLEEVVTRKRGSTHRDPLSTNIALPSVSLAIDEDSETQAPIKPPRLVREMRAVMPKDSLLFVDNGNSIIWATHYFEARAPMTYFLSLGLASMGNAVASAIGGKLAAPDKPVVSLTGDAAFAMNGMDVHTAVEHHIPVVWVVLNNGGHGMVYHGERMLYGHDLGANRYRVPLDLVTFAKSIGARGLYADTPKSFRAALDEALGAGEPVIIDAQVDAEEVPQPLLYRARAVARSIQDEPLSRRSPWVT